MYIYIYISRDIRDDTPLLPPRRRSVMTLMTTPFFQPWPRWGGMYGISGKTTDLKLMFIVKERKKYEKHRFRRLFIETIFFWKYWYI